jgi:hypothetical protein
MVLLSTNVCSELTGCMYAEMAVIREQLNGYGDDAAMSLGRTLDSSK